MTPSSISELTMNDENHQQAGHQATLPALNDHNKQIRLLLVEPAGFNEAIHCTVFSYYLSETPAFNAISYTWGPVEPKREIYISGQPFQVRENAHYAIRQARNYQQSAPIWIWIDSICINQDNLPEKGAQVAMMGDIYAKAATVLACIGPSGEDTDAVEFMLEYGSNSPPPETAKESGSLDDESVAVFKMVEGTDLHSRYKQFDGRAYFRRLWVAQELFAGRGRAMVLWGLYSTTWVRLAQFDDNQDVYLRGTALFRLRVAVEATNKDFAGHDGLWAAFHWTRHLLCADPRDRIFGALRLVNWKSPSLTPPDPNYQIEAAQLALNLIRDGHFVKYSRAKDLINGLEISDEHVDFIRRSLPETRPEDLDFRTPILTAYTIVAYDGRLYMKMVKDPSQCWKPPGEIVPYALPSTIEAQFHSKSCGKPIKLYNSSGQVAATACPATQHGSLLVETSTFAAVLWAFDSQGAYLLAGAAIFSGGIPDHDRPSSTDLNEMHLVFHGHPTRDRPGSALNVIVEANTREVLSSLPVVEGTPWYHGLLPAGSKSALHSLPRPGSRVFVEQSIERDRDGRFDWDKDRRQMEERERSLERWLSRIPRAAADESSGEN